MEASENQLSLNQLPLGARLLVRSKKDWRSAVVSKSDEAKITLIVCSPSGRTYRVRRALETKITFEGRIPILKVSSKENWRQNFSKYDMRW
jgi:hypothetical protein